MGAITGAVERDERRLVIGVPLELKTAEYRVAATPAGVAEAVFHGHQVLVERGAGLGSGFSDQDYRQAGARIAVGPAEVWGEADLIWHVKEPQPEEYPYIRSGQVIYAYFHFAASESLTLEMARRSAVCVAYETMTAPDGSLPLLRPMSEVAGRIATEKAAQYLSAAEGGLGKLMGGVPGVEPATVVVLGGGVVGTHAARVACGMGAQVYLLEKNPTRLAQLYDIMPANCTAVMSNGTNIRRYVAQADAVIGAVLLPDGAKAPKLVSRDMLKTMKDGSVIVDVAVDQGGCFETTRPTTHDKPVYTVDGVTHYCVANMPGSVPATSTPALTNVTLPYALELAEKGWKQAARDNPTIRSGLNVADHKVTCRGVADTLGLTYTPVEHLL